MGSLKDVDHLTIEIKISESDIVDGFEADCYLCPAARALSRELMGMGHGDYRVSVGTHTSGILPAVPYLTRNEFEAENPYSLTDFIRAYDARHFDLPRQRRFTLVFKRINPEWFPPDKDDPIMRGDAVHAQG